MDFYRYWDILRRQWWLLLLGALIASGISLMISQQTTPVYQTSTKLLINPVQVPGVSLYEDVRRLLKTYSELLQSRPILEETIAQLGLQTTPGQLAERIAVTYTSDSLILRVIIEDSDPVRAATTANQLAQIFIEHSREMQAVGAQETRDQVARELEDLRRKIDEASGRLSQLRATPVPDMENSGEVSRVQRDLSQYQDLYFRLLETQQRMALAQAQATSSLLIAEPAQVPTTPIRPLPLQTALLAGLVGLLLALGLVLLIEYFDDRLRDPEALRRRYQLPHLSVLPFTTTLAPARQSHAARLAQRLSSQLTSRLNPAWRRQLSSFSNPLATNGRKHSFAAPLISTQHHRFTDAVSLLRANLDFVAAGEPLVLAVTSATRGEGKSTIAANLAIAEAKAGKRVILVDADLRKPSLHRFFRLKNDFGLSNLLSHSPHTSTAQPDAYMKTGPLGIQVLASGPIPPGPAELLSSHSVAEFIQVMREQADIIILDSPPLLDAPDALILQQHVHGFLLVIDSQRVGWKMLDRALAYIQSGKILGVAFNKAQHQPSASYNRNEDESLRGTHALDATQDPPLYQYSP